VTGHLPATGRRVTERAGGLQKHLLGSDATAEKQRAIAVIGKLRVGRAQMPGEGPTYDLFTRASYREPGAPLSLKCPLANVHGAANAGRGVGAQQVCSGEVAGERLAAVQDLFAEGGANDRVVDFRWPARRTVFL